MVVLDRWCEWTTTTVMCRNQMGNHVSIRQNANRFEQTDGEQLVPSALWIAAPLVCRAAGGAVDGQCLRFREEVAVKHRCDGAAAAQQRLESRIRLADIVISTCGL